MHTHTHTHTHTCPRLGPRGPHYHNTLMSTFQLPLLCTVLIPCLVHPHRFAQYTRIRGLLASVAEELPDCPL
jgi:hypothetical protein